MSLYKSLVATLAFAAVSFTAHAQYTVEKVVFKNTEPYAESDLLLATGLQAGQILNEKSLVNVSQHLVDSGLFDDAQVSLTGLAKARTVNIVLKPKADAALLPVTFQNLVWFTPAELAKAIHAKVPLYRGFASDAGNFPDDIQAALQQILTDKGIAATVTNAIIEPTTAHPVLAIAFRVTKPPVLVASLNIDHVTHSPIALNAAKVTLPTRPLAYNEGVTGFTIEDFLLGPARRGGFVAARLEGFQRTYTDTASVKGVTVAAKIVPGDLYKVSTITWETSAVYSAADFARDNQLHAGDVASDTALTKTETAITAAYRAQGYIDAYLLPNPTLDTPNLTVAYSLKAVPGEVYRIKSVTPLNLGPEAKKEFDAAWRLKPGDVYNERYVQTFIQDNTAKQNLARYSASYQANGDPATHQVDLVLTFVPGPR